MEQTRPAQPAQPEPSAGRSLVFMMMMMLYFYGSGPNGNAGGQMPGMPSPREMFRAKMERQHHSLDVLNGTRWGDFAPRDSMQQLGNPGRYLNLTGFREGDGYVWEKLGAVKERVELFEKEVGINREDGEGLTKTEPLAIYENVTGIVHGKWARSKGIGKGGDFGSSTESLNLTNIAPEVRWAWNQWSRNITGREGKVFLKVDERDENYGVERGEDDPRNALGFAREISATLTVQDESSTGDGWEMRLHGIHWPHRGSLVLTTTSGKFSGIFGLPHLTVNKDDFRSSQQVLNRTLNNVLIKKENSIWNDLSDPWSREGPQPLPHCEYVVYVQVFPVKNEELHKISSDDIKEKLPLELRDLENELRFPSGAPASSIPPLRMSFVAFSPDCGFVLESKGPPAYAPAGGIHLEGYKQEVFVQRVRGWSLIWGVLLLGQILLIRMQMKEASTPSTMSRISVYPIGMMAVADTLLLLCMMLLASSTLAPGMFPAATIASFGAALGVGLGFRFIAEINNVQEPQRRERERIRLAEAAAARPPLTPNEAATPVPIITAAGAEVVPPIPIPTIIPSDQDIDAEFANTLPPAVTTPAPATLTPQPLPTVPRPQPPPRSSADMAASFGQGMLVLMLFFLLTINSTYWPPILRTIYTNSIAMIYLSFWIPQIYRNVMRNCRKAFLWKFVIGQSVLRAAPFAYFYLKKDNIIFAETSSVTMIILAGWLWIQIWVLAAQEVLGPRFGLPKGWLPEAWDYHPILREDDVEGGGMPIGLVQIPGSPILERTKSEEEAWIRAPNHTMTVDCAICMNALEVPVVPTQVEGAASTAANTGGVTGILARRLYMVTPCRHVFHSNCLEGWMRFRLQCPICRETLPAL